jgi:hypothetical protein
MNHIFLQQDKQIMIVIINSIFRKFLSFLP